MPDINDLVKQITDGDLAEARESLKDIVTNKLSQRDSDADEKVKNTEKCDENR